MNDGIGGANGILTGNAVLTNGALSLDGTNSSLLLPNDLFTNYDSISFEIWFVDRPLNKTSALLYYFAGPQGGMSNNLGGQASFFLGATTDSVNLKFPAVGRTNHLVWTQDSSSNTARLYVNGCLAAENTNFTLTPAMIGSTTTNRLGSMGAVSTSSSFRGNILAFRTYQGALTPLEVALTDSLGADHALTDPGALQDVRLLLTSPTGPGAIFRTAVFADFANATNVDVSTQPELMLSSDNTNAVAIAPDQRLQTVGLGTANVTASYLGFSNTVALLVSAPEDVTLIHRYSFGEAANDWIVHDSVGQSHGRLLGSFPPPKGFTGKGELSLPGTTFSFQSGAYVALPDGIISGLSEVSIEAWVTWTLRSLWPWQRIFDFGDGPTYFFLTTEANTYLPGTNHVARATISTYYEGAESPRLNWTNILPLNVTSYVAVTYSPVRGVAKFYLNGQPVASATASIFLSAIVDTNDWLGRSQYLGDNYFGGRYDEFRIYRGLLQDSDVAQDYTAGPNGTALPWPGPQVSTLPAAAVAATTATLSGSARPNGLPTTVFFQYGTTTNYGATIPPLDIGEGSALAPVSISVAGLAPQTLYHFRCVAANSAATSYGGDFSFTTGFNITNYGPQSGGGFFVQFSAVAGTTYTLQSSTDLVTWSNLAATNAVAAGSCQLVDSAAAPSTSRYYRLQAP
ncbi:MAG: LamG-like jellyroll fold domain-containing protein [Verrucomicrobiota bacterium]